MAARHPSDYAGQSPHRAWFAGAGSRYFVAHAQKQASWHEFATAALAVHELNAIAAAGNYLKAAQVHGDFAQRVQSVALGRVQLNDALMEQALPWHVVQQYFARTKESVDQDILAPTYRRQIFTGTMPAPCWSKWRPVWRSGKTRII